MTVNKSVGSGKVNFSFSSGDEKNLYEPEAVVHGQPLVGGHGSIESLSDNDEDDELKSGVTREQQLAGTPEEQKI